MARVLAAAGFAPSTEPAHLCWDESPPGTDDFTAVEGRYFNWLPGSDALAMKGRLARALGAARERAERAGRGERFDFFPRTYLLPDDVPEYHEAARRMPGNPWIWRYRALGPSGKAAILATPHDAGASSRYLIQEYVAEPHLLDGYKYTLRFYLAVTSLVPLVAWISEDGFCRFASQPFVHGAGAWGDRFRHVTSPEALVADPTVSPSWQNMTLASYRERLRREGLDDAKVFAQIELLLQSTLVAAREAMLRLAAEDKTLLGAGHFGLFSADVTLDEAHKPWLLGFQAAPSLTVGAARNLPVAAREEVVFERIVKDLLTLAGALAPEPPAAAPEGLAALASWIDAREARRGSFRRLFPTASSGALLCELEQVRTSDAQLALLARPAERRGLQVFAQSFPLDGGLLVASESGRAALLEGASAQVWQGLARGESVEQLAASLGPARAPAECERLVWEQLTVWVAMGLAGWDAPPAQKPVRPPTRWNGGRMYEVDGLRVLVRSGGADSDVLVQPLLAPFERTPRGAPDRVYDLVNHDDGWALFDSEQRRRWRGTSASFGAALLGLVHGEAMRAAGRLGAFEALFLREKGCLLVPARGLFRGLAEQLAPLGFETLGAPLFLSVRNALCVAERAGEDGLHANHLVTIEVDRKAPESAAPSGPFPALRALFANARGRPELVPAGAASLLSSLSRLRCDALVAHGVASAARQIVELLSGTRLAAMEAPKLSLAPEPDAPKLSLAR